VDITPENMEAVIRGQIAKSEKELVDAGYDASPVRERVAGLSQWYGGPVLDVGTGAGASLAVAMARKGLRVTAVDRASSAVRIAQERAAGSISDRLDIRRMDAANLTFADGSYRVVTAFDALCHAAKPGAILDEMFRVSSSAVIVTELNTAGRQITQHHDGGFEKKLPGLLAHHCRDCQQIHDVHHVTFVCEKPGTKD
jgi:2-polyprenyl-3-methyl-5-hydroxy-6-metoxy-1,4-benzoquinol methylase